MKITDSVQYLKGVGPKKKAELARLGIARVYDVLTYFPRTYEDQSALTRIADLRPGTVATVAGTITVSFRCALFSSMRCSASANP